MKLKHDANKKKKIINQQTFLQNSLDKISCVIFIIHLQYRHYNDHIFEVVHP